MEISGKDIQEYLRKEIDEHIKGALKTDLAELDPIDTFTKAHSLIRSIEEFINICAVGIDLVDFERLRDVKYFNWDSSRCYWMIDQVVKPKFGEASSKRIKSMVSQSHKLLYEFASQPACHVKSWNMYCIS
jgi:hypothetical protein